MGTHVPARADEGYDAGQNGQRLVIPSSVRPPQPVSPAGGPAGAGQNNRLLNGSFLDFRPAPGRSVDEMQEQLREAEARRAMESLERAQVLDQELIRVRRTLEVQEQAESRRIQSLRGDEAEAPVAAAAPEVVAIPESGTVGRLLAGVRDEAGDSSVERARMSAVRESLTQRQQPSGKYAASSRGTEFHATLEFNRSIRGTGPADRGAPRPDTLRGSRPSFGNSAEGRAAQQLAAAEAPISRRLDAEGSDSVLMRHRPRYQDSTIAEQGSGGGGNGPPGELPFVTAIQPSGPASVLPSNLAPKAATSSGFAPFGGGAR